MTEVLTSADCVLVLTRLREADHDLAPVALPGVELTGPVRQPRSFAVAAEHVLVHEIDEAGVAERSVLRLELAGAREARRDRRDGLADPALRDPVRGRRRRGCARSTPGRRWTGSTLESWSVICVYAM